MNNINQNTLKFIDLLQIFNTYLNLKQTSSDDILKKLEDQDDVFLKQILEKLNIIETKLDSIERQINVISKSVNNQ